eukprot:SAG22_NODE_1_length_62449_cov_158.689270_53_plen_247_part_00
MPPNPPTAARRCLIDTANAISIFHHFFHRSSPTPTGSTGSITPDRRGHASLPRRGELLHGRRSRLTGEAILRPRQAKSQRRGGMGACPLLLLTALVARPAAAQANTCRYANDNACDEPRYCRTCTDCADCNNCEASAPPQPRPTIRPATMRWLLVLLLALVGCWPAGARSNKGPVKSWSFLCARASVLGPSSTVHRWQAACHQRAAWLWAARCLLALALARAAGGLALALARAAGGLVVVRAQRWC